ncbi:MAG: hypothetical protein ACE5LB_17870 [Acidiferrobacterales bacterium]
MTRTTIDIDTPLLKDLKRLQKQQKKSLDRLVSDLLAEALAQHRSKRPRPRAFEWTSQDMQAFIDISDKNGLYVTLDESRE